MTRRLFLKSVRCEDVGLELGFQVGDVVTIEGGEKRRDLPGGDVEYATSVRRDDDASFDVRVIAHADGSIAKVHASATDIPEDWYDTDN